MLFDFEDKKLKFRGGSTDNSDFKQAEINISKDLLLIKYNKNNVKEDNYHWRTWLYWDRTL